MAKEFTVTRKQTIVSENSWFYRWFMWLYPDFYTKKITFCRMFWGFTLLLPFALTINVVGVVTFEMAKGIWWGFTHFLDWGDEFWDKYCATRYHKWRERRKEINDQKVAERQRSRIEREKKERDLELAQREADGEHHKEVLKQRFIESDVYWEEIEKEKFWRAYEDAHVENNRLDHEAAEKRRRAALLAAEQEKTRKRRERWERAFRLAEGAGNAVVAVATKAWPVVKLPFYALGVALIFGASLVVAFCLYIILKALWIILTGIAKGTAITFGGIWWLIVTCGTWLANNVGYIGGSILAVALLVGLIYTLVRGTTAVVRAEGTHKAANFILDALVTVVYYVVVKPLRLLGFPVKWGAVYSARGAKRAGAKVGDGAVKAADHGIGFVSAMFMGVKSIKYKTCPIITVVDEEGNTVNEKDRKPKDPYPSLP